MKVNWKELSATDGYKSLKAAYIFDVKESMKYRNPMREKSEFIKHFQWVISRAKHYACHQGLSIETVLNSWEEKRSYWWLNFYQDCNQPKLNVRKWDYKKIKTKYARCEPLKKPRWGMSRKKNMR